MHPNLFAKLSSLKRTVARSQKLVLSITSHYFSAPGVKRTVRIPPLWGGILQEYCKNHTSIFLVVSIFGKNDVIIQHNA